MTPADVQKLLSPYRRRIDRIDDAIIRLLGKRYAIVREVADLKIRNEIAIVQNNRVHEVKDRNAAEAKKHGVSPELVRTLYALIIDEAHVIEHGLKKAAKGRKRRK